MTDRPGADLLARFLELYQFRASVFATPDACGAWQIDMPASDQVEYHLVASGRCYLHLDPGAADPLHLAAGDVVVFPRSRRHVISRSVVVETGGTHLGNPGEADHTELICGTFVLDRAQANPLVLSLADVVVVRGSDAQAELRAIAGLLAGEARARRAARQSVLDRLSEVLFVHVLRHELDRGAVGGGLLAAFTDPAVRQVLVAIHDEPGRAWTVAALAEQARLSRTAFVDRFHAATGVPPMQFLTEWRMRLARLRLQARGESVATVANDLGYATEAAFRRAFKRVVGVGPGAVRRAPATTSE